MIVVNVLFFFLVAVFFWTFFGYRLFLSIASHFSKKVAKVSMAYQPTVTLMILTYNEEKTIGKKIENSLALDYPKEKLDILVIDSNSTDRTCAIVNTFSSKNVRLIIQEKREGKASAVHYGIQHARGEIVACTDANAYFNVDVLSKIVPFFSDETIGGVTGGMQQKDTSNEFVSRATEMFWRDEKAIRAKEASLHSVVGMSGEICVFRKSIFSTTSLSDWYIAGAADDACISLFVIKKGFRIAYAANALVWEHAPNTLRDFIAQRTKVVVMTIVMLCHSRKFICTSTYGVFSLIIFPSRKLLPLFSPFILVYMFIVGVFNVFVSTSQFWLFFLAIFVIGAAVVLLGFMKAFSKNPIVLTAMIFFLFNVTMLVGWTQFFFGKEYTVWEKVDGTRR